MQRLYQKFRNIDFIKQLRTKKSQKQSSFYQENRKQVLSHYRYLLKNIPAIYQRRLQQRSIYIEICYLFHQSKILSSIEETRKRRQHLDMRKAFLKAVIQQFKAGDYGNIGIYLPARQGEICYINSYLYRMQYRLNL